VEKMYFIFAHGALKHHWTW